MEPISILTKPIYQTIGGDQFVTNNSPKIPNFIGWVRLNRIKPVNLTVISIQYCQRMKQKNQTEIVSNEHFYWVKSLNKFL